MNLKRAAAATVAAWIVYWILSYLVNIVLFPNAFTQPFYRPASDFGRLLPLAILAMPIGFAMFVLLYAKSREAARGVAGGIRMGLLVGVLLDCFAFVGDYVALPLNAELAAIYLLTPLIRMPICGAVVGMIYRPASVHLRA